MALAAVGRICTVYSDHVPDQDADAADQLEPHVAAAVVDVFVYVVVLNLFVEYLPQVISETFTLSLLTAVLLKGVLNRRLQAGDLTKHVATGPGDAGNTEAEPLR